MRAVQADVGERTVVQARQFGVGPALPPPERQRVLGGEKDTD